MRINKYQPHLLVLPEDDANRQIVNGFEKSPNIVNERAIQVLPPAGGWESVVETFEKDYASTMERYKQRMIVLLIDFDSDEDRLSYIKNQITPDLQKRVFVLGVLSEPEKLKTDLNQMSYEEIGKALANDCYYKTHELWGHELLKHNKPELERMIDSVKPFLFD